MISGDRIEPANPAPLGRLRGRARHLGWLVWVCTGERVQLARMLRAAPVLDRDVTLPSVADAEVWLDGWEERR